MSRAQWPACIKLQLFGKDLLMVAKAARRYRMYLRYRGILQHYNHRFPLQIPSPQLFWYMSICHVERVQRPLEYALFRSQPPATLIE